MSEDSKDLDPQSEWQKHVNDAVAKYMLETGGGMPVIRLDLQSQRADQLRLKLEEYRVRSEKQKASGENARFADSKFKEAILGRLLEKGSLDLTEGIIAIVQNADLDADSFEITEAIRTAHEPGLGDSKAVQNGVFLLALERADQNKDVTRAELEDMYSELAIRTFHLIENYVEKGGDEVLAGTGLPSI